MYHRVLEGVLEGVAQGVSEGIVFNRYLGCCLVSELVGYYRAYQRVCIIGCITGWGIRGWGIRGNRFSYLGCCLASELVDSNESVFDEGIAHVEHWCEGVMERERGG